MDNKYGYKNGKIGTLKWLEYEEVVVDERHVRGRERLREDSGREVRQRKKKKKGGEADE